MKKYLILFIIAVFSTSAGIAQIVTPKDVFNVEALILLHKSVAKWEDEAKHRAAASALNEAGIQEQTDTYEGLNDAFHSKRNNLLDSDSWGVLANVLRNTVNAISTLSTDLNNFMRYTYPAFQKHPESMAMYTRSVNQINREIRSATALLQSVVISDHKEKNGYRPQNHRHCGALP